MALTNSVKLIKLLLEYEVSTLEKFRILRDSYLLLPVNSLMSSQHFPLPPQQFISRSDLLEKMKEIVGKKNVLEKNIQRYVKSYRDPRGIEHEGKALCVLMPGTLEELSTIQKFLYGKGLHETGKIIGYVQQGGNTGLTGASTPNNGEIVISLERLNKITNLNTAERTIYVEAGTTLQEIQNFLDTEKTDGECPIAHGIDQVTTLGGAIMTRGSGSESMRKKDSAEPVRGYCFVLPDGTVIFNDSQVYKRNSFPHFEQMWYGSQGVYGTLAGCVLTYLPKIQEERTLIISAPRYDLEAILNVINGYYKQYLQSVELLSNTTLSILETQSPDGFKSCFGSMESIPNDALMLKFYNESTSKEVITDVINNFTGKIIKLNPHIDIKPLSAEQQKVAWNLRRHVASFTKQYIAAKEAFLIPLDISIPFQEVKQERDDFTQRFRNILETLNIHFDISEFCHAGDSGAHINVIIYGQYTDKEKNLLVSLVKQIGYRINADLNGSCGAEHGVGPDNIKYVMQYEISASILRTLTLLRMMHDPFNQCSAAASIDSVKLEELIRVQEKIISDLQMDMHDPLNRNIMLSGCSANDANSGIDSESALDSGAHSDQWKQRLSVILGHLSGPGEQPWTKKVSKQPANGTGSVRQQSI
ncbi:MAG: FAD-binding oxidoreductase [Alphaproteobacteria bacterium]|nr:FAD-binding oxidoreductase [Alphaproteobacteria bacterium]